LFAIGKLATKLVKRNPLRVKLFFTTHYILERNPLREKLSVLFTKIIRREIPFGKNSPTFHKILGRETPLREKLFLPSHPLSVGPCPTIVASYWVFSEQQPLLALES